MILFFHVLTLALVFSKKTCENPMMTEPNKWGLNWTTVRLFKNASSPEGRNRCKYYTASNDRDVCCSNQTLEDLDHIIYHTNNSINTQLSKIDENNFGNRVTDAIQNMTAVLCSQRQRTQNKCSNELFSRLEQNAADVRHLYQEVIKAKLTCAKALLTYSIGILCISCDPEWDKYIDKISNSVNISSNSCSSVFEYCSPVFALSRSVLNSTAKMVNELSQELDAFQILHVNNVNDMCGGTFANPGDCKEYLCDSILDALKIPTIEWDARVEDLIKRLDITYHLNSQSMIRSQTEKRNESRNHYISVNGYDAFEVGSMDLVDDSDKSFTSIPPNSRGKLSTLDVVFLIIGIGILVFIIVFMCVLTFKRRTDLQKYIRLEEH